MSGATPPRIEDFELLDNIGSGSYATVYKCIRKVYNFIIVRKNPNLITFIQSGNEGGVRLKMRGHSEVVFFRR